MQDEDRVEIECSSCGTLVDPEADPCFLYGEGEVLCFTCAVARGGAYDELHDRWVPEPSIEGLPDERRAY